MKKIFTICLLVFTSITQLNAKYYDCMPTTSTTTATICTGGSYTFNGVSYNAPGIYTAHLTNAGGCDSAATLELRQLANANQFGNALYLGKADPNASAYNYVYFNSTFNAATNYSTSSNFTIEAWINPADNHFRSFFSHKPSGSYVDGYALFVSPPPYNNKLYLEVFGDHLFSTSSVTVGQWNHVALVYAAGVATWYINGVASGSGNIGITPSSAISLIGILSGGGYEFNGGIDELRIWNSARTQSQIVANMNKELAGNEAGLYGYFKFNQGAAGGNNTSINTLTDATARHNNGILANFDLTGNASNFINNNALSITGVNAICVGSQITLGNDAGLAGGIWSSSTKAATINSNGVVTGATAGSSAVSYKYTTGGCDITATANIAVGKLPAVPSIAYGVNSVNPQTGAPAGSFCRNRTINLIGIPGGGVWSGTGVYLNNIVNGVVSTGGVAGSGTITYEVSGSNGCTNNRTISFNVAVCASKGVASQQTTDVSFTVYPNPTHSQLTVNCKLLSGTIIVTDLYGRQVKQQLIGFTANTIDVSNFAKGVYFVSIVTELGKQTQKVIVE